MRLGKMHRRITIRKQSAPTRNAMNEPVRVWTTLGTFWAEEDERALRGMETVQAGQQRASEQRTWHVRWTERTATIGPLDRVIFAGAEYEIVSAFEIGRRDKIEIKATGPVPPGA